MKVRIGISLGPYATPDGLAAAIDRLESAGVDSLWLSEVVYGDLVEPLIGMTYTLARTSGSRSALAWRCCLAGIRCSSPRSWHRSPPSLRVACCRFSGCVRRAGRRRRHSPSPGPRAAVFDESLELLKLLLTQPSVSFSGRFFSVTDANHRAAAGEAARHLARRQRAGGPAPGRPVRRRLARQLPDPGGSRRRHASRSRMRRQRLAAKSRTTTTASVSRSAQ